MSSPGAPLDDPADLAPLAWRAIVRSRWALEPRRWSALVVVVEPPAPAVVEIRQALAERLRAAGLAALAHDVLARRVGDGEVLLYAVRDDAEGAGVLLERVNLLGARRAEKARRR